MTQEEELQGPATPIKLLVACLEEAAAQALCTHIHRADERIAAEAVAMSQVPERAAASMPDVALLEYRPDQEENAWWTLSRLSQVSGHTRVLLLCASYTHLAVAGFIQRGASGCLLTSSPPALWAKAVRAVHQDENWFPRTELLRALRSRLPAAPVAPVAVVEDEEALTAREREILALVGNAMTNKEIARQLKISDHTVKTHLHHIYVKLQQSGRYKALLSNTVAAPRWPAAPRTAQ